jgi:hypothetical protein
MTKKRASSKTWMEKSTPPSLSTMKKMPNAMSTLCTASVAASRKYRLGGINRLS